MCGGGETQRCAGLQECGVAVDSNDDRFNLNGNNHNDNHRPSFGILLLQSFLMKRHKHLFEKICAKENLEKAFKKARKGKTTRPYVIEFEKDLAKNLTDLQKELQEVTYSPIPLKTFVLRDPKTRKICVSDFRDRIVHHAICNVLEPIYERLFIYDSYANRKGKGTLAAIKRFDSFAQKVSYTKFIDKNEVLLPSGYVFKADIRKYFENISHKRLLEILQIKIEDHRTLLIIERIIQNYHTSPERGMPLGNLTSQFLANVYLHELDIYVKHTLRAKYYIRYVDDFVILHPSRIQLEHHRVQIESFLQNTLSLQLHSEKSKILPVHRGVDFLGFRCFAHTRLLRKRNMRSIFTYLNQEKISTATPDEIHSVIQGWTAYAKLAQTHTLRKRVNALMEDILIQKTVFNQQSTTDLHIL